MTSTAAIGALIVMATVTYLTRLSGVWALKNTTPSTRLTATLDAITASVLVAIAAPAAYDGDPAARMATVVAVIVMATTRKPLLAVSTAVIFTAAIRAL